MSRLCHIRLITLIISETKNEFTTQRETKWRPEVT